MVRNYFAIIWNWNESVRNDFAIVLKSAQNRFSFTYNCFESVWYCLNWFLYWLKLCFLKILLFLYQVGGNNMFKMLWDTNFTYDSSMPIYENRPPSWPYTLDYKLFHDCMIPPCPTRSYPGLWEVPMVMWQDLNGGRCSMGDACSNPPTSDGVYKMLIKNFERHYTTNRLVNLFYYFTAVTPLWEFPTGTYILI